MILVTGATGNVGGALVSRLSTAGVPVRALVRSPERGDDLRGYDVDLAVGSLRGPASLGAALDGVDRVFLLSPASEQHGRAGARRRPRCRQHAPAAHVVKLAAAGVDAPGETAVRFLRQHREVVRGLRRQRPAPHRARARRRSCRTCSARPPRVQEQGVLPTDHGRRARQPGRRPRRRGRRRARADQRRARGRDLHDHRPGGAHLPRRSRRCSAACSGARSAPSTVTRRAQSRARCRARRRREWLADGLAELDEVLRDRRRGRR